MEKRLCRNSGLELSVLGTGCWTFGGGEYWGDQNQSDVNEVVHASVDMGITYFDTAEAYNEGRSELSLGIALKGISRDKVIIGTKVSPSNCYRNTLIKHCEASLKRLQTDNIDVYMVHWPIHPHSIRHFTSDLQAIENPPRVEEAVEALHVLRQQGKIRYFGVSNFSYNRLKEWPVHEIAVNQLPYNLLCRAVEFEALPLCSDRGIGVIGYMALMQGILSDSYKILDDVPAWRRRTRHFNSSGSKECRHGEAGIEEEVNAALQGIRELCKTCGLSMAELSILWILQNQAVSCTLAGARNIEQLTANVRALNHSLSVEVKEKLDSITEVVKLKLGPHFDYYESAGNDRTL
jgi:myo-inositol catabolism protein IolS